MDMDVFGGVEEKVIPLKRSAVSGVRWTSLSLVIRQGVQWITTIILARILLPADFGLIGMVLVVIGLISLFRDLGFSAAVIQRKEITERFLSSIFWVNVLLGLMATVIPFFLSNFIAYFYHEPKIVPVLKVLSLTFFISGLSILQQSLFQRELDFRSLAIYEILSSLIGSLVSLTLAFQGFGVWSLVFQSLVTTIVMTVLLFVFCRWKPRLVFKWAEVRSITRFSLNLTGYNIFNYFARNMDNILIGKFLGAEALGYYSLAYRIMLYPLQAIYRVIGRVIFPLFSQIQSEDARFRGIYLKLVSNVAIVTFPIMMMVMVLAEPFVLVLFGPQWMPAVVIVVVLAPIGLIQSVGMSVGVIYQAKGRTDWMFRWGVGVGILVMIAFVIGLRWGILGVAVAYGIVSLLCAYHNFAIPFRLISLPMREFGRILWRPFFCSLVMGGILMVIKSILPASLSHAVILGILIFCGISVYLLTSLFINRHEMKQAWSMAIMVVKA